MINQLNIFGKTKVETAIERLRRFEPEYGYSVAFSGGKDSVTIKRLCEMAGVKHRTYYSVTSIDPPELVQFVKTFDDVEMRFPKYSDGTVVTMWNLIPRHRMPPTRLVRYCCEYLKERTTYKGEFVVLGVRWDESPRRKQNRGGIEISSARRGSRRLFDPDAATDELVAEAQAAPYKWLNPIIDWTDEDVWEFIKANNAPYCGLYDEGFKRLGCVGCPMAALREKEFERWPKYKMAYMKAFEKMIERNKADGIESKGWETAEDVMAWWLRE